MKAAAKTISQNIGMEQVVVATCEVLTFQKEEVIIKTTHILSIFAKRNTEMQNFERFTAQLFAISFAII